MGCVVGGIGMQVQTNTRAVAEVKEITGTNYSAGYAMMSSSFCNLKCRVEN